MQSPLISCPACRKSISTAALTCPNCGKRFAEGELAAKSAEFEANWQQSKGGCWWIVGIIVAVFLLCALLGKLTE